jgi:alkylation response protein AidB-like acyl-CoA dehydrogenase
MWRIELERPVADMPKSGQSRIMAAMQPTFPLDRAEKRRAILDAVEGLREVAAAHAGESEASETLAPAVVEAMAESGLWALKLPAELGGAEADPVTQIEAIEAMTSIDTSAGWALMIGATSVGWPGAFLPKAGMRRVFGDADRLPTAAGIGGISGTAVPVEGGYRVTGRFAFSSGIRHAEWLLAGAPIARGEDAPAEARTFVVPAEKATVHLDSWHVAGLKGSGSHDFSLEDVFVPEEMSWDRSIMMTGTPERGGAIFRLGMPAFTANEHAAFALGCARRALDLLGEMSGKRRRATGTALVAIGDRPVFQHFYGEADQRLKAVRAHTLQLFEQVWQTACSGRVPDARAQAEVRACAVLVTDTCVDIVNQAFHYAGGSALQESNVLQRYWRDVNAGAQHMAVSNAAYEAYGQVLLGIEAGPQTAPGGIGRA